MGGMNLEKGRYCPSLFLKTRRSVMQGEMARDRFQDSSISSIDIQPSPQTTAISHKVNR